MLSAIGLCGELFHTPTGKAFADIPVNDHRETWSIRRFTSALPSTPAASISISPMSSGAQSKSVPRDGGWLLLHRSGSAGPRK